MRHFLYMALFCCTAAFARSPHCSVNDGGQSECGDTLPTSVPDDSLLRQETARNEELTMHFDELQARMKNLQSEAGKDGNRLETAIRKKMSKLDSRKNKLAELRLKMGRSKLYELSARIKKMEERIDSIEADTFRLTKSIVSADSALAEAEADEAWLKEFKDSVSRHIVKENAASLELPFSKMDADELAGIISCCRSLSADKNIGELMSRTGTLLKYKKIYDGAVNAVNSRYDRTVVEKSESDLKTIVAVNAVQEKEVRELMSQLGIFEAGIDAFRDFITELNRRRDGADSYSRSDFNDDLPNILERDSIGVRIERHLRPVPYLDRTYDEYLRVLGGNPMSHPDIEQEILNP